MYLYACALVRVCVGACVSIHHRLPTSPTGADWTSAVFNVIREKFPQVFPIN